MMITDDFLGMIQYWDIPVSNIERFTEYTFSITDNGRTNQIL